MRSGRGPAAQLGNGGGCSGLAAGPALGERLLGPTWPGTPRPRCGCGHRLIRLPGGQGLPVGHASVLLWPRPPPGPGRSRVCVPSWTVRSLSEPGLGPPAPPADAPEPPGRPCGSPRLSLIRAAGRRQAGGGGRPGKATFVGPGSDTRGPVREPARPFRLLLSDPGKERRGWGWGSGTVFLQSFPGGWRGVVSALE